MSVEQTDWRTVPADPDPETDLGYELLELDMITTGIEDEPSVVMLPRDEELLHDAAFIVASEDIVRSLSAMR